MKAVTWIREVDGGLYPFCPYCGEFAYEKDHCVFCGKKYIMHEKRRERKVTVGEYTVVQTSNNNVSIAKGGSLVYHAQCTKRLSRRELKKQVAFYESMSKGAADEKCRS